MTDTVLLEAALFQVKSALGAIDDPMFETQAKLTLDILSNAVAGATQSLNPATVNDVEFALNDVIAIVGELSAAYAAAVQPAVDLMQSDLAALKAATALPDSVVGAVRNFQAKLKVRRSAIERQTYREAGAPAEALPHPPAELRNEAVPIRQQLATAGFATPALDGLIADPESLRFHSISEILDELDVIIGG